MEMTGLDWEYIDNFEFVVVVGCFLTLTHRSLHTLWYATNAPIPPGSVFIVAAKAFGWASLLSAYLMFRVNMLIIAGFIGLPIVLLGVTVAVLVFASITSIIAYSGLYGRCVDRLFLLIRRRSVALGAFLTALVLAPVSIVMAAFRACGKYIYRSSPFVKKWFGTLRDRLRILSVRFAQK